ncbi:HK97 gp10 family phage protein [Wukongibacter sp. M2B1]|uniref:HK97 gp10 family phage protein n=1 Tax=Wukongibacter sp. M2B1 TaxID=3088895 RepID=UPI003D7BFFB7
MADDGFNVKDLDDFTKDLLAVAQDLDKGRHSKKFLRKEGNKLKRRTKKLANQRVKEDKGNYHKSIKRGKVYKYQGKSLSVRCYSSDNKAHLIEDGHRIVDRNNKEHGFMQGKHVFKDAEKNFRNEFIDDCEEFIDDLLVNHGL